MAALAIRDACCGVFAGLAGAASIFGDEAATTVAIGLALHDVSARTMGCAEAACMGAVVDTGSVRAGVRRCAVGEVHPFTAAIGIFAALLGHIGVALFGPFGGAFVAALAIRDACCGIFADLATRTSRFGHKASATVGVGFALNDVVVRAMGGAEFACVAASVNASTFGASVGRCAVIEIDPFTATAGVFSAFLGHVGVALFFAFGGAFVAALAIGDACCGVFADLAARTSRFGHEFAATVGVGLALNDVVVCTIGRAETALCGAAAIVNAFSVGACLGRCAIVGVFPDATTTCIILAFLDGADIALCRFKGGAFVGGASRCLAGGSAGFAVFVGFAVEGVCPDEAALTAA